MNDWISVSDKLPELIYSASYGFSWESKLVLTWEPRLGTRIGALYAGDGKLSMWWLSGRHGSVLEGITHWMPLPDEPPEKG